MNTIPPFPVLRVPGLRDPLAALRGFVAKCRGLARRRADHGTVLELNVTDKLIDREAQLRAAGAKSAELIAKMIEAAQADFLAAVADGKLTAAEQRRHRAHLDALYARLAELSRGLALDAGVMPAPQG